MKHIYLGFLLLSGFFFQFHSVFAGEYTVTSLPGNQSDYTQINSTRYQKGQDYYNISGGNVGGTAGSNASSVVDLNDSTTVYSNIKKSDEEVRGGDFSLDDIPKLIVSLIEMLLGLAGTISIVALIYHAVQMQLASGITGDSSGVDHAKKGMKGALIGFVVSMSAWFLIVQFIKIMSDNF